MIERRRIIDRATWLAWRRDDLTASDTGAVAGVDPHRTALAVYAEKAGLIQPAENNIMRRGRWLEAAVEAAIREQHPELRIEHAGIYIRDAELRLGATPDRLAEHADDPGTLINLQLKVVARPTFEREWPDETVPLRYQLQTLTEGMLLDAGRNMIAALVLDTYSAELVVRDIPRHAAAESRIRALSKTFWNNMDEGRRPDPDYGRDTDTIAALYPHADQELELDLSGDNRLADLLGDRAHLKGQVADWEARLVSIDNEIKDKLGAAERATLAGWRLSWKNEERAGYQVEPWRGRKLRIVKMKEAA